MLFLLALSFSGYLELNRWILVDDTLSFYPIFNTLRVEATTGQGDLYGLFSFDLRFYDVTGEMGARENLYPYDLSVYEAYFEVSDFLIENLDLKAGKQRISWGTADKLNPTDNLNPDDLSNPINFGEHIPTEAVMLSYYVGDFSLTGVLLPIFHPALLPQDGIVTIPPGPVEYPEARPENMQYAVKFKGNLFNFDFSLSCFDGYDDFPYLAHVYVDTLQLPYLFSYSFSREKVFGFDFAGELFSVGLWGEVAYFIPDGVCTTWVDVSPIGPQYAASDTLPSYWKGTFGFDYSWHDLYINVQYAHGLPFERKEEGRNLGDFVMGRLEYTLFDDKLKVALNGGVEMRDDSLGWMVSPSVEYHPTDNIQVEAGYFYGEGEGGTIFDRLEDFRGAILRAKLSF